MNYIIVADGDFPFHPEPLSVLKGAKEKGSKIIACDGAITSLVDNGYDAHFVVGDMDTLSAEKQEEFSDRIHRVSEQESNDLSKAFHFTLDMIRRAAEESSICILGATGKREDHTIGNISLLADYAKELYRFGEENGIKVQLQALTNFGIFLPYFTTPDFPITIENKRGHPVSIFAFDSSLKIVSEGLEYATDEVTFDMWWKATLNKVREDDASLRLSKAGAILLYFPYL